MLTNYNASPRRNRPFAAALAALTLTVGSTVACAEDYSSDNRRTGVFEDIKLYVTAPLHWDGSDWAFLGGSVVAFTVAHHYDADVRQHFVAASPELAAATKTYDVADAVPAAAALLGTWAFAAITSDSHGKHEAWSMAEAAALSSATSFLFKFAAGRERPNETSDTNSWRASGDSFPSLHATAAFAIGGVLAESGNDDYRWVRRVLGYGIGVATSYQRTKHNVHWVSDTVAGAALGIASARFVLNRDQPSSRQSNIWIAPADGGLSITYSMALH